MSSTGSLAVACGQTQRMIMIAAHTRQMAEPVNPQRRDTETRAVRWQSRIAPPEPPRAETPPEQGTTQRLTLVSIDNASAAADVVRRYLERLAKLDSPALCRLVAVTSVPGGLSLSHACPPGSVSVAEILDAPTSSTAMTVAQAAEIGAAVCDAAIALHAARLAHGGISLDNVLISPSGVAMLTATGATWGSLPKSVDDVAASDVADIVALIAALTTDALLPACLARTMLAFGKSDSHPTLGQLRTALAEVIGEGSLRTLVGSRVRRDSSVSAQPTAQSDAPVVTHNTAVPGSPAANRARSGPLTDSGGGKGRGLAALRQRPGRWAWIPELSGGHWLRMPKVRGTRGLVIASLALAFAVAGIGVASQDGGDQVAAAAENHRDSGASPSTAATPTATAPAGATTTTLPSVLATSAATTSPVVASNDRWKAVLGDLDRLRSAAFAVSDAGALADVDAPESPALARDGDLITKFQERGIHPQGFSLAVQRVAVVTESTDRVMLQVVDTRPAYSIVDAGGQVVQQRKTRGSKRWRVSLVRAGTGWLIADVEG